MKMISNHSGSQPFQKKKKTTKPPQLIDINPTKIIPMYHSSGICLASFLWHLLFFFFLIYFINLRCQYLSAAHAFLNRSVLSSKKHLQVLTDLLE